jgi:hypothetical protein
MNRCLLRSSALLFDPALLGDQIRQNPKKYKPLEHAQLA